MHVFQADVRPVDHVAGCVGSTADGRRCSRTGSAVCGCDTMGARFRSRREADHCGPVHSRRGLEDQGKALARGNIAARPPDEGGFPAVPASRRFRGPRIAGPVPSQSRGWAPGAERMETDDPLRVLVIEDDADTRANLSDVLKMDGHQSEMVTTAAEALSR